MHGVYLYQTIHVLGGQCYHLPAHIALLDRFSHELFGRRFRPDESALAQKIISMARQISPAGCDRSQFVRLLVPACCEQEYRLEFGELSLYRGYDLRSLTPDAVTLQYDLPLGEAPTSAHEAIGHLARQQARLRGASVAVRCGCDGFAYAADEVPLFAVLGKRVYTSPAGASVERDLALSAIEAAGLELTERPIERAALPRFDELFYIDHRGLTALAHCDGHPYMAILAERIARALRGLFPEM
ncbi:aminotransferase class IV [uncultured Alistipes sp.]|jgi:hypothetical protein|uniref:aminotransferase class IV n=1 Tax=uncultured Alistipes sp. TaxID=538949 RepID=UPI0025D4C805|nr:aminotransferase class IV [uncultured Alistipes sp.]